MRDPCWCIVHSRASGGNTTTTCNTIRNEACFDPVKYLFTAPLSSSLLLRQPVCFSSRRVLGCFLGGELLYAPSLLLCSASCFFCLFLGSTLSFLFFSPGTLFRVQLELIASKSVGARVIVYRWRL